MTRLTVYLIAIFGSIAGLAFLGWVLSAVEVGTQISLPILSVAGVMLLMGGLALVAVSFADFGLQDKAHALGLPEGSIRAVIALSLIMLFSILTVFMYSTVTRPNVYEVTGLSGDERDLFVKQRLSEIVSIHSDGSGDSERFTIALRADRDESSDEFAKQIFVLLGTLVTSIASFYFGAKAGAASPGSRADKPALRSIKPEELTSRRSSQPFELRGDNLSRIKEVKVVSGADSVPATDVTSNDNVVRFNLALPNKAPAGAWDVVAVDDAGNTVTLPAALSVT